MLLSPVFLAKHEPVLLCCNLPAFIFTPAANTRTTKLNPRIHPVRSVVSSRPISRVRCFQSTRCQYPPQSPMKLYETTYSRSRLVWGCFLLVYHIAWKRTEGHIIRGLSEVMWSAAEFD